MVCEDREVMFKRIRGRALKENRIDDSEEIVGSLPVGCLQTRNRTLD